MASGLIDIMQQAAKGVMDSAKLCDVVFGTVTKKDPYEIRITPSLTIKQEDDQITFARQVTDYETSLTLLDPKDEGEVKWITENRAGGSGDAQYESHNHEIKGKHHVKIHNKLKVGDKAILLRMTGGQHYIVLDKVGEL